MLREFILLANEEKRIQVEGKYLVVTKASGPVELTIGGTTPVTVDLHGRIHLRSQSPNDRAIRIKNLSGGINQFEIHTSDLLIDKRQAIDVKESIQIAPNQRIGIDPQTNIVQAIIQNPVKLDPSSNTITIEAGQQVGIDPNTNTIKLESGQLIGFDPNSNTIKIETGQLVGIDPNTNTIKAYIQHPLTLEQGQAVCIDPNCNTVHIQ